ncbi:hypothetical protein EUX98_g3037 [Antrodiella citrinella]|uniref:Rabenosyn Rab binding domain-containing protein n=1 Tax=Antrodiella citrinella TaxID=2447956 RepID=A0A4S4MXJ6_9APHY|nr:hypothetical protein EUX98_g3037 [Antrodiella citrinella]
MSSPPPNVPYQAYRSKRHSRNVSNPYLTPNVSPPPASRPPVSPTNGLLQGDPAAPQQDLLDPEKQIVVNGFANRFNACPERQNTAVHTDTGCPHQVPLRSFSRLSPSNFAVISSLASFKCDISSSSATGRSGAKSHSVNYANIIRTVRFFVLFVDTNNPSNTHEYLERRKNGRDESRVERTRLERRLEKLINLHFPHPNAVKERSLDPRSSTQNRRQSSFFDLSFNDLRTKSAGDLWKEVVAPQQTPGSKADIRCLLSKRSLLGRTTPKSLSAHCADPLTGSVEEVVEGVDYGVRRRTNSTVQGKGKSKQTPGDEDKFLKGVRICRDCRPVLLRRQYIQEIHRTPLFSKLYDAFISLEKEIEDALPQFQELLLNLSNEERPAPEASSARKRLLDAFAQYDALAKRIRQLPCPGGQGGSQDRVQQAIFTRANLFLQKNMFPLQALPTPKKASNKTSTSSTPEPNSHLVDPDSEIAHALQPLLEQEALLESFVEEAKAHRKFEDAKTLKANLAEIRVEIDRIMANAGPAASGGRSKGGTSS